MRRRLWQLHSWLGLICGLALLIIGLSGSLLVFHEELEGWLNPELVRVTPPAEGATRLALDVLLRAVVAAAPDHEVTGWLIQRHDPGLADLAYVVAHGTSEWRLVTIDPYTAEVLAGPFSDRRLLTSWLLEFHYTFFVDHAGMIITGVLGTGLCVLGLTGVWIHRRFWRSFFTLRWRASARIFFADAHKMIGISSVVLNLVLGFTGAYWNITHVAGHWWSGEDDEAIVITGRMYGDALSLDAAIADAHVRLPGFEANYLGLPWKPGVDVTLWGSFTDAGLLRSDYGSVITYGAQTGAHMHTHDIRSAGAWAQFVDAFRPLHFGDFGGLPVKIVWSLAGLTPGLLAVSGTLVWWHRRRRGLRRHRRDIGRRLDSLESRRNDRVPEEVVN